VANALALAGKSSPNGAAPASFGIWVYKYPFWDNPMIGSACPADDISPPRYRQIHPFQRPGRILGADGGRPKGRRPDQRALAVRLKKLQSFVAKYVGGERRLDVVEFIRISRALDADPLKLVAAFLANTTSKSARAKAGPKRDS
jgi:hypothetical protein